MGDKKMIPNIDFVNIENVYPEINGARYHVKRTIGDIFNVEADIFSHGHDVLKAKLLYRKKGDSNWDETAMELIENDRWHGAFLLEENAFYEYTIFAWRDPFLTWVQDTFKKYINRQNITDDLLEGKSIIEKVIPETNKNDKNRLIEIIEVFDQSLNLNKLDKLDKLENTEPSTGSPLLENVIFGEEITLLMDKYPDRSSCGKYDKVLTVFVNRREAEFSTWYEMWHRSQGKTKGKSANFKDMENRLKEIHEMGFNVIYLPPIHPVGITNRKGPNNSLICPHGSPGSIFAIGNKHGGHMTIESSLGNMEDFCRFEKASRKYGMEIALDLAIQSSPDHPWVKEHPQWFNIRPDGSIKYAENPPKKYEDIYPINFDTEDKEGLWLEILKIVRFWMSKGVRIFRVDNPHTKPILFWEWLIKKVHKTDPDIIFLAEAFTRPKVMKALGKIGFTQSYTYFTWRNFKQELIDYFNELINTDVVEYLWGNLFTNTPDILPQVLQDAPGSAFKIRATLAATLSSIWGIYNGFELCEGNPIPGKEEYLDSEKYEYKVWDWNRPGNIKDFIKRINLIRKNEIALQKYRCLKFYKTDNDNILFYVKNTEDYNNIILVIVNLDPYHIQESYVYVPVDEFGIKHDETYQVHNLLNNERFYWQGKRNFVSLDPNKEPAHIFRLQKLSHKEQDFDYFY